MEDEASFRGEVRGVCKLYHPAEAVHAQGIHVVSTDEKTGIQALKRIHPNHPPAPGKVKLVEFELDFCGNKTASDTLHLYCVGNALRID